MLTLYSVHAHIVGVQFIQSNRLLTTSVDQRINLWIIDSSNSLILTSTYIHDVADVSSLCTCYIRSVSNLVQKCKAKLKLMKQILLSALIIIT